ncbi:MAG: hypothetical protein WB626_08995 [Bacteroidota bacterium]
MMAVLILEREAGLMSRLQDGFTRHGYDVHEAARAEEAALILEHEEIALVVCGSEFHGPGSLPPAETPLIVLTPSPAEEGNGTDGREVHLVRTASLPDILDAADRLVFGKFAGNWIGRPRARPAA